MAWMLGEHRLSLMLGVFTARVLSWFINTSSITHVHERLGRKHATIVLKG